MLRVVMQPKRYAIQSGSGASVCGFYSLDHYSQQPKGLEFEFRVSDGSDS